VITKVLLVEDYEALRDLYSNHLRAKNFEVGTAEIVESKSAPFD
jgi:hypothetical protein